MAENVTAMKTRKGDAELVLALAAGATRKAAATQAGVSERTVFRRMQEPEFRADVANARTELVSQSVGILAASGTSAAHTLRKLLDARSEHVRLGAAKGILEILPRLRESEELSGRIAELERLVQEQLQMTSTHGGNRWSG